MYLRIPFVTLVAVVASVLAAPPLAGQETAVSCDISGTEGDDVLVGTDADEVICGFGGDDVLIGGAGSDELIGGAGVDRLIGGDGADHLRGGDGHDWLFGGPGADIARGGDGDDSLVGGPGRDVLRGGAGKDTLAGGDGADTLWGGEDDDVVRGAKGADVLYGGPGDDVVRGGVGVDRLRGGPGDDVCIDTAVLTNGINCAFGRGGDDRPIAVGQALWRLLGSDEFVYSMSGQQPCVDGFCRAPSFVDIVHVRGGLANSGFGSPARSAEELFGLAEAALADERPVVFDPSLGLPRLIGANDSPEVEIYEIQLRDVTRQTLDEARVNWARGSFRDYSYTVETSCFCPASAPIRVTVVDGVDVTGEVIGDRPSEWSGGVKTIEGHLDDIADLLDGHVIDLSVDFDPETGIPVRLRVDRDRRIADEEYSIAITDFEVLATPAPPAEEPTGALVDDEHPADDFPTVLEIVDVAGIQVSSVIADDVQALIDRAAEDGLELSGGGFRDPQRQIDLRRTNCGASDYAIFDMPADQCSPPTARPGQSQHELGLAIDFTNNGRLVTSQSDPAFIWLAEHAATFGLINLETEPWHWSTTGN